jgi:hypothetical protein
MIGIRDKIIAYLEKERYRYTQQPEVEFDRNAYDKQVTEELDHHTKQHSYSALFKNQIIDLYGQGFVNICGLKHPYEFPDISNIIDGIVQGRVKPKPFNRKSSCLYGKDIYHSHHSQSFYIEKNQSIYFQRKYKNDEQIIKELKKIQKERPEIKNAVPILMTRNLLESINRRDKTGEWIVYQKKNDKIHFLCLHVHDNEENRIDNDSHLFSIIKDHLL